jgi:hypothetical protein
VGAQLGRATHSMAGRATQTTPAPSSSLDEKRDSDEANNYQGGTSDEHVTDMISRGARSNRYLVVVSHDRTFVRVHRMLLSWAQHGPLP